MKANKLIWPFVSIVFLTPVSIWASDWQPVVSEEGRFSIQMPGVPDHKDAEHEWVLGSGSIAYYLRYIDLSTADTRSDQVILKTALDSAVGSNEKNQMVSKSFFIYKGFSGAKLEYFQDTLHILFYIIVVHHRLYMEGYSNDKDHYKDSDAKKYLESLQFTKPELNTGLGPAAATPSGTPWTVAPGPKLVNSPEWGFSISMPYAPQFSGHAWTAANAQNTVSYNITFGMLPDNDTREPSAILDAAVNGSVTSANAKLISKTSLDYQGFKACEIQASTANSVVLERVILAHQRVYAIVFGATPANFDLKAAHDFFSTLKLTAPATTNSTVPATTSGSGL